MSSDNINKLESLPGAQSLKYFVFISDFDAFVGDTPRLDTSAHKAKAQLALKVKRQPPSRSKLKESLGAGPQNINLQVLVSIYSTYRCMFFSFHRFKVTQN